MTAEIDTASQRHEGRARHPVRRRRHTIEDRWNLTPSHIVGIDLHCP